MGVLGAWSLGSFLPIKHLWVLAWVNSRLGSLNHLIHKTIRSVLLPKLSNPICVLNGVLVISCGHWIISQGCTRLWDFQPRLLASLREGISHTSSIFHGWVLAATHTMHSTLGLVDLLLVCAGDGSHRSAWGRFRRTKGAVGICLHIPIDAPSSSRGRNPLLQKLHAFRGAHLTCVHVGINHCLVHIFLTRGLWGASDGCLRTGHAIFAVWGGMTLPKARFWGCLNARLRLNWFRFEAQMQVSAISHQCLILVGKETSFAFGLSLMQVCGGCSRI